MPGLPESSYHSRSLFALLWKKITPQKISVRGIRRLYGPGVSATSREPSGRKKNWSMVIAFAGMALPAIDSAGTGFPSTGGSAGRYGEVPARLVRACCGQDRGVSPDAGQLIVTAVRSPMGKFVLVKFPDIPSSPPKDQSSAYDDNHRRKRGSGCRWRRLHQPHRVPESVNPIS